MFIPKGVETQYLFNPLLLNSVENTFLLNHTFICFNTFSDSLSKPGFVKTKSTTFSNSSYNHYAAATVAFGFKDFISSTAFGSIFNCGQLDVSYGLDIIFVIRYVKNQHLLQPHYFLSSFQMPF